MEGKGVPAYREPARPGPARPSPSLAVGLLAAGTGVAVAAGLGAAFRTAFGLDAALPAVAAALAAAVASVAVPGARRHHPFVDYGPANFVTGVRAVLVSVLAAVALVPATGTLPWGLIVFATVAALLDVADGLLARRSRLASPFGARFDMEIDALLILVLALLAWRSGKAGAWVRTAGALRYVFVAAAGPWPWLGAPLPPSTRRQAVCVIQIVTLIVALAPIAPWPASAVIAAIGLVALIWSFWVDVRWLRTGPEGV
jgi:phosphatidylglycerophosphate synthase